MKIRSASNRRAGGEVRLRESLGGGIGLHPKDEDRNPKEIRRPKTDSNQASSNQSPAHFGSLRISDFDLPLGCGRRPSAGGGLGGTRHFDRAYMLTEALVYIGLIFLLLGIAYGATYRLVDNSVALRRNADDIIRAVHAGERWRADLRAADKGVHLDNNSEGQILRLERAKGEVDYRFADGAVLRRIGAGPWSRVLERVRSSAMERESRPSVTVWRWELELEPQNTGSFKTGRIRPLFTFLGVPAASPTP